MQSTIRTVSDYNYLQFYYSVQTYAAPEEGTALTWILRRKVLAGDPQALYLFPL